jgi:acetolactate synthase I/II/III large subunit
MSALRVADYIANWLVRHDIKDVFMVTGGGAMHLNDALGNHPDLTFYCNHHEQACAIAAEGYFRATGKMPVVNVTTGPGGTNTLTGVLGQWDDSIPALYLSGQVKWETTIDSCPDLSIRQVGDQEGDIIHIVKPVTKYAVMLKEPKLVRKTLEKAYFIATHGRPGPVWIDIPLNVQSAIIDEQDLPTYDTSEDEISIDLDHINIQVSEVSDRIKHAKSPAFIVGLGIRLSNAEEEFAQLLQKTGIPVLTAISGSDFIESDSPLYFGRPGICGDRLGNITVQNSDLLIVLGTRLGLRQTTYNYDDFGRKAFKIMVDIDKAELAKPTFKPDLKIHCDLKFFLKALLDKLDEIKLPSFDSWLNWGNELKKMLPSMVEENKSTYGYINSYRFVESLFDKLPVPSQVVTGNGTAYTCTFQVMKIRKGIRVFANQGCAAMGYDLPAAIGACIGRHKKDTYLITGDGSIMMNLQELQTIAAYCLPVKIFLLDNNGYLAIRITQTSFFDSHFVGESPGSRLHFPDFEKIASAFGLAYYCVSDELKLDDIIQSVISHKGPVLCRIIMNPIQTLYPKVYSLRTDDGKMVSKPMEEMFPFLPDEIMKKCSFNV